MMTYKDIVCDAILENHHRHWQQSKIQYLADTSDDPVRRAALLEAVAVLNQRRRFNSIGLGAPLKTYRPRKKLQ